MQARAFFKKKNMSGYASRAACVLLLLATLILSSAVAPAIAENDTKLSIDEPTLIRPLSAIDDSDTGVINTEELMTAVYAHCDYKLTLDNAIFADKGADDGVMLTDLVYTSALSPITWKRDYGWVRFKSKDGDGYEVTVTLDFGFAAKDVCRFYLRSFRGTNENAETPDKISFFASADGHEYDYVGDGTTMTDLTANNSSAVFGVTLDTGVTARYIRAVIQSDGAHELWLNEVGAAAMGNTLHTNDDGSEPILDSQGLIYRIKDGKAEVCGMQTEPSGQYGKLAPSSMSFDADGKTYYLGIGSDNTVKVTSDFIGEGMMNYSGVPNNIQYIVIHNTATVQEDTTAERYNDRMHNMNNESGWHYTVDDKEIYHSLSDSIVGFHAGATHNYRSIGIEICVNGAPTTESGDFVLSGSEYDLWVEERFDKSIKNAAVLTAELLTRYGLSTDAIIQHYDVTTKNCPLWMRANDGELWLKFLDYVDYYYTLFNGDLPEQIIRPQSDIVIPDYIRTANGDIYPVSRITSEALSDKGEFLKNVYIGKTVDTVEAGCFDGNPMFETVNVSDKNTDLSVVDGNVLCDASGNVIFDPATIESEVPAAKEDCTLDIRGENGTYYIFDKANGNTVGHYVESYGAENWIAIGFKGERLTEDDIAGNGTLLIIDGTRLYISIVGDCNGNGEIDTVDYTLVKRACMNNYFPITRQFLAIDVNYDGAVNSLDYIMIKRHVFGTFDLTK